MPVDNSKTTGSYRHSVCEHGEGFHHWDPFQPSFVRVPVYSASPEAPESQQYQVYLLLGLIAMLVVLETFCELQQLKQLRKIFYLKKEKPQDQLPIVEHDHMTTTSTEALVDVTILTSPGGDEPMIR